MARKSGISPEDKYALQRLKNQTDSGEGTNLPPRLIGEFRVPFVQNLRLVRSNKVPGQAQTVFTLAWDEPTEISNISHYAVYIKQKSAPQQPPLGPFTTTTSPAQITLDINADTITFLVQTVLKNGLVSDFNASPTCTGDSTGPSNNTRTTDATITTIETLANPSETTLALETIVVARRTFGTAGTDEDGARYKLSAVFKNVAGIATQIGVTTKITDENQAAWDANFVLTGTDQYIYIKVTGAVNNHISWKSFTTTYPVSF